MEKDKNEINNLSLEDTFAKIDIIMEQLQDDSVPLEESFGLYKNGMEMLSHCRDIIDEVEKKVQILSGDSEEE